MMKIDRFLHLCMQLNEEDLTEKVNHLPNRMLDPPSRRARQGRASGNLSVDLGWSAVCSKEKRAPTFAIILLWDSTQLLIPESRLLG